LNDGFVNAGQKSISNLVACKIAVEKHDIILDDKIELYQQKLGQIDGNN